MEALMKGWVYKKRGGEERGKREMEGEGEGEGSDNLNANLSFPRILVEVRRGIETSIGCFDASDAYRYSPSSAWARIDGGVFFISHSHIVSRASYQVLALRIAS